MDAFELNKWAGAVLSALLVPPQAEPFAAAIARLLDDPGLGGRLSGAARDRAGTRYSRDAYVARTREVCERLARPRSIVQVPSRA